MVTEGELALVVEGKEHVLPKDRLARVGPVGAPTEPPWV